MPNSFPLVRDLFATDVHVHTPFFSAPGPGAAEDEVNPTSRGESSANGSHRVDNRLREPARSHVASGTNSVGRKTAWDHRSIAPGYCDPQPSGGACLRARKGAAKARASAGAGITIAIRRNRHQIRWNLKAASLML